MSSSGNSLQDQLDLALSPLTDASKLGILAESGYEPVQLAVVNHPNVTVRILNKCVPPSLDTIAQRRLAAALARHKLTPVHALDALTDMVVKIRFEGDLRDACMDICIHSHTRDRMIRKILNAPGANSSFRNDLWKRCENKTNEAFIRSLLSQIKQRHKQLQGFEQEATQTESANSTTCTDQAESQSRCIGHWIYEEFYSGGHTELHMLLAADGDCLYSSGTRLSMTLVDSMGNWQGCAEAASNARPDGRGRWHCNGNVLTLEMEDDTYIEYEVLFDRGHLITTNTTNHTRRIWSKQA